MACSQVLLSQINDDYLTCQICMEPYHSPKVLNCQHSFCTKCLESCDKTPQGSYILCPVCRQRTVLGLKGIQGLKSNFVLSNIIDMLVDWRKIHIRDESSDNAEMCQTCPANETAMATYQCIECLDHLCADCAAFHSRTKLTKDHEVVPLHEVESGKHKEKIHSQEMSRCSLHQASKLEQYCSKCDILTCRDCIIETHQGHPLVPLNEAIKHIKQQVQEIQSEMETGAEFSQKSLEELIKIEEEERQELAQVEQDVERLASDFISLIKEKRAILLSEIEDIQSRKLANFRVAKEHLEIQLRCMLNCTQLSGCVLEEGTASEILNLRRKMSQTLKELKETTRKVQENYKESIAQDHCIRFIPGNITDHASKGLGITEKMRATKAKQISLNVFVKPSTRAEQQNNHSRSSNTGLVQFAVPTIEDSCQSSPLKHTSASPVAMHRSSPVLKPKPNFAKVKFKEIITSEKTTPDCTVPQPKPRGSSPILREALSENGGCSKGQNEQTYISEDILYVELPEENCTEPPVPSPRPRSKPVPTPGKPFHSPIKSNKPQVMIKPNVVEPPECYKITRVKRTIPIPAKKSPSKPTDNHYPTMPKPSSRTKQQLTAVIQPYRIAPAPPMKVNKAKEISQEIKNNVEKTKTKVKSHKKTPAPLPPTTSRLVLQAELSRVFGTKGQGYRDFQGPPTGVATTSDKIFILDSNAEQLIIFNHDGFYQSRFAVNIPNQGKLKPTNVTVSLSHQIYILFKNLVTVWSFDGTLLTLFGHNELIEAHGITVDSQERVIVTDQRKHEVIVFNKRGNKLLEFGGFGQDEQHFQSPRYVCVTSRDEMVISDNHNHCVKIFDRCGKFLTKFGSKGPGNGSLNYPESVTTIWPKKGQGEVILVADEGNNRISAFDLRGHFKYNVLEQTSDLGMKSPQRIATSGSEKLVVLQTNNIQARIYELHAIMTSK